MNHGLQRLDTLPLSLRLIREIHRELMQGVRGADKDPGEFRRSQNWIGPAGVSLARASYVPPPPAELMQALGELEGFLHRDDLPVLVQCALAHAQFEMIHPFLDGNGRVGRLLITLLLCEKQALRRPLLYLSLYLKRNRGEYYERLTAIHERGDWEGWLAFFLRGVAETAAEAAVTADAINDLRERSRLLLQQAGIGLRGLQLLTLLLQMPLINARLVADRLGITRPTASSLIGRFVDLDLLQEITGAKRDRVYRFTSYLRLFEGPDDLPFERG